MPTLSANTRALQNCVILTAFTAMIFLIWPGIDLCSPGCFLTHKPTSGWLRCTLSEACEKPSGRSLS